MPLCKSKASSKGSKEGPLLVPSPGDPPQGYTADGFLQNCDFGKIDPKKYNIDLSLQVHNPATIGAFVKARERWMKVITGDVPDSNVTEALLQVNETEGSLLIDACANLLPSVIDDVHICALEASIDEGGEDLCGNFRLNIIAFVYPGMFRKDGHKTLVNGNIIFDTCDAPRLIKSGLWEDFVLKAMGTVIGGTELRYDLANLTSGVKGEWDYIGKYGNQVWRDWGCSGKPPMKDILYSLPEYDGDGNFSRAKYFQSLSWDSTCLVNEVMGGVTLGDCGFPQDPLGGICAPTLGSKLSKLSVAALRDLGYKVNYAAADKYDGHNTTCCFPDSNSLTFESIQPVLSEDAKDYATEIGRKLWNERKHSTPESRSLLEENGGDVSRMVFNVLIEEKGHLYNLAVPLSGNDLNEMSKPMEFIKMSMPSEMNELSMSMDFIEMSTPSEMMK